MAKYKAYPEYKDSGMEWCTALPLGWKRTNLRWLSSIYAGGTPSKNIIDYWENGTVPWINSGAVNQSYVTEPSTFITKAAFENSSAKWIPKGALVVALAGQGKTKGMVAQLGINTTCNQSMAAIVFYKKNLSRYIYWWLTSNYQNIRNMAGGDLRDGLNLELLGDIQCPQPNDGECTRISAFLDHETAKIDNLIGKQQQLIELLREKRQAVISHAVTKGLNSDVPMKDSGVEWLGNVPEHWQIKRCKNLFEFVTSGSRGWAGFYSDEGDLFFRITNLTRDSINPKLDAIQYVTPPKGSEGERSKIKENDLLISITADLGSVCAADESISGGYVSQHVSLCRPGRLVSSSRWLAYFVLSDAAKEQLQGAGYGGTKVQLNLEDIRELFVAYPPKNEQDKIAFYLDKRLTELDDLDYRAHNLIEILRERRTALISAAVTGKIDVRDWVAPDTQDIEEPQEATA
ncbi:restriction endonuclease subunit S [Cronobacter dublinensis]